MTLENDQLKGDFFYNITKTDKEGLVFDLPTQNSVIEGLVFVATKAVQYAAYVKQNELIEENIEENQQISEQNNEEQTVLAQEAMDVRKKELDSDKAKQVDRLNQTWDKLSAEKKIQFKQDQLDWFKKRDVECKVLAQKTVDEIPEKDLETYQKQSDYRYFKPQYLQFYFFDDWTGIAWHATKFFRSRIKSGSCYFRCTNSVSPVW